MLLYRRAVQYFKADRWLIAILLSVIGLQTALGLLAAWPMAVLIDSVLSSTPRATMMSRLFLALLPQSALARIVGLAIIGLLMKLASDLLGQVNRMITARINYNGLMRVRCELFRKLQVLSLSYHRARPQADAIYRLSQDTYGCQAIMSTLIATGVAAVTLIVMTGILLSRNATLTVLALGIAPFLFATNVIFERRLKARSADCRQVETDFTMTIQRSLAAVPLIQAYGRERQEYTRFRGSVRQCVRSWFNLHWQEVYYWLIVGAVMGLGSAAIFGYGGYLVWRDQFSSSTPSAGGMTVGDLILFTSYLGLLWDPLCKLTGAGAIMQSGAAAAQRVFEVLDLEPDVHDKPNALPLPRQPRTIELDNVHFAYQGGKLNQPAVLKGVSAKILPGQMVAFVGASGGGKSTLLNLLPRFYDPTSGVIKLDGHDARDVRLRDLRRHIALVLQESLMLPTSIAENIAFGRPDATDAQIRQAAELAGAAEFIDKLPHGYDTLVNENGSNLSGGQRQRISIARALLAQSPVIVLDEPTSALDPLHEQHITECLRNIKGTRTVVLVSHRLSTVMECDQIFMMENGLIVEHGTHAELMAREGKYWQMARHQLKLQTAPETIRIRLTDSGVFASPRIPPTPRPRRA